MSVPSFSSFPDLGFTSITKVSESQGTSVRKKKGEKKSKRRHDKDVDREHRESVKDSAYKSDEDSTRLFYSDRKGDRYNIEYGGLHEGDIPRYNIINRGKSVLGLSSAWVVTNRKGKGIEVGPRSHKKMAGLTDFSSRELLSAPPTRRILQSKDTYQRQEVDGFLRLPSGGRPNKDEQSYRSITRLEDNVGFDSDYSDASGLDDESSGAESDKLILTSYQITLKELEQQLREDPTSIDRWLRLLSHTLSTIPTTSKNATTARSEIALSILARAFTAHENNRSSELLRLTYVKAGEEIWHESKVRAEWESALNVGGVVIWMEWLEWRIRKGDDGVDGIVRDAVRVLGALNQNEQDEIAKVRVFWRVAVALKNAGFPERATAMFQAQGELTFMVPQALHDLPHGMRITQLEEFWESETPRIGEEGAEGWAAWILSHRKHQKNTQLSTVPSRSGRTELDPYRQWVMQELYADHTHILPSRSFEESGDPYSTILFSDIQPLLIQLLSRSAKKAFRKAWLSVLGLHIPGFSASLSSANEVNWDDRWNEGHLIKSSYLAALFPKDITKIRLTTEAIAGVIVGREKEYASGFGLVRSWGHRILEPLDLGVQIEKLGKRKARGGLWGQEDLEGLNEKLARRLFAQLRLGEDDEEWDVLSLAFEAAANVKNAITLSRSFLSKTESLQRWAAHAQLEMLRGRLDDARRVYQAVLIRSHGALGLKGSLWWNWVEMEWLAGNSEQALDVILRAIGVDGRGDITLLRSRRSLDDFIKDGGPWKQQEAYIKMRALLELLIGDGPTAALAVFDNHLFSARRQDIQHESLTLACLTMLYHHGVVLKNPIQPLILRRRVGKALEEYPSNSVILGLFLEGERGHGIWGHVRGTMGESGGKVKDVTRRIEEVWMAGWVRGGWMSEIERTRNGLAAAIENGRTRASHIIWRVYLELEIRAGELQRAKKLYYRSIGECPLVKELYLLAFGPLRGVFSGQELSEIADTMVERGLRLREGLDEALAGWVYVDEENKGDSSDSGNDEIVENARELRRLMPY